MLELKAGINRVNITGGWIGRGAYRLSDSLKMQPYANELYRQIWERVNCPLADGEHQINCTRDEFVAGYDYALGIDLIFKFANGTTATLQEKFLTTDWYTITVEYMQDWRNNIQGDWFNMKCQYYFVGYYDKGDRDFGFTKYALVDWSNLQRRVNAWKQNENKRDGARSNFKYIYFNQIPRDCAVVLLT